MGAIHLAVLSSTVDERERSGEGGKGEGGGGGGSGGVCYTRITEGRCFDQKQMSLRHLSRVPLVLLTCPFP